MTAPARTAPAGTVPAGTVHVPYACTNCGFWQRWFASGPPPSCPVCTDVRNALPDDGFAFVTPAEAEARLSCSWRELRPGLTEFSTSPRFGLDSRGWVLDTDAGRVGFECAPWYGEAAVDALRADGGLAVLGASHVHGYGALWRLQDALAPPVVTVGTDDLVWTKAFRVTWPADETLVLASGVTLHRTGGHFAGHSVLHDAGRGLLFCGDALKVDLDGDGRPRALSAHKAFHAQIPLSRAELRRYREVLGRLDFDTVLTPFECAAGVTTADVVALLDRLAAGPPSASPVPLADLRP